MQTPPPTTDGKLSTPELIASKPNLAGLESVLAEFGITPQDTSDPLTFTRDELCCVLSGLIQGERMLRIVARGDEVRRANGTAMAKVRAALEDMG